MKVRKGGLGRGVAVGEVPTGPRLEQERGVQAQGKGLKLIPGHIGE